MKAFGVDHLYIRFFDVDWSKTMHQAMPIEGVRFNDTLSVSFYTPVVFITNNVFEKSLEKDLDSLSIRIQKRIEQINSKFETQNSKFTEILIDCDWSPSTKEKYFYFLKRLKLDFPEKEIASTLRLWQLKNPETAGIPPVKHCLLMCYNLQSAKDYAIENSIISLDEFEKYIPKKKYPLALDVALPIYHWAVLFREGRFEGLLGDMNKKDFDKNPLFEKISDTKYRVTTDSVIDNFFIRKSDEIRLEGVSSDDLQTMVELLKPQLGKSSRISFFAWNHTYIQNYENSEIKNIYAAFGK